MVNLNKQYASLAFKGNKGKLHEKTLSSPVILNQIDEKNVDTYKIPRALKIFLHNGTHFRTERNLYSVKIPCLVLHLDLSSARVEEQKEFYLDSVILLTTTRTKDPDCFVLKDIQLAQEITQNWIKFVTAFHHVLTTAKIILQDSTNFKIYFYCHTCQRVKRFASDFLSPIRLSSIMCNRKDMDKYGLNCTTISTYFTFLTI